MSDRSVWILSTLLLTSGVLGVPSASAQWWVDAALGGASHEAVTAHVDSNNALLALRRDGTSWLQLAGGLPLGSEGSSWGSLAGGTEFLRPGVVAFGGRAGGQGYLYSTDAPSSDGWGAIGEVGPLVRLSWATTNLEIRSGGIASRTVVSGEADSRLLLSNVAQLGISAPAGFDFGAAAQYVFADEAGYPMLAASVSQALGRGGWWGRYGHWISDDVSEPEWSIGAYANAGQRFQLHALFRQETNDPIYQRQPRRSWSIGLSVVLGRRTTVVPAAPLIVQGSEVTVRIPVLEAVETPFLAGDFNSWKLVPMVRDGDFWVATFEAVPGVYRFSFTNEHGSWFLPPVIRNRVADGFGGENGVLVVL